MNRTIAAAGFIGWAAIIYFAHSLAVQRIDLCHSEHSCVLRATATADNLLVAGMIVALVAALALASLGFARRERRAPVGPVSSTIRTANSAPGRKLLG